MRFYYINVFIGSKVFEVMDVDGKPYRTIFVKEDDKKVVQIIDQRWLPHKFIVEDLRTVDDFCVSIEDLYHNK